MAETVYVKTSHVRGSVCVYHTDRLCNHLLSAHEVVEKDRHEVADVLRECSKCSGDLSRYQGQCTRCEGGLDEAGDCPFCERFAEVIEA